VQFALYALVFIFVTLSFFMLFAFYRTHHVGLLYMSFAYGLSGMAAGYLMQWWPLGVGLALAWLVKLMGFDPDRSGGEEPRREEAPRSDPPGGA